MTIIIHKYKPYNRTSNTICLYFFTIVKGDLLEQYNKGVRMYKEIKADKQILDNLLNGGKWTSNNKH